MLTRGLRLWAWSALFVFIGHGHCVQASPVFFVSGSTAAKLMSDLETMAKGDEKTLNQFFDNSATHRAELVNPQEIRAQPQVQPVETPLPLTSAPLPQPPPQPPPPEPPSPQKKTGVDRATEAIQETPKRISDAWRDPIRRRNSISRIVEALVGGGAAILGFLWLGWLGVLLAVPAEFIYYEYLAEPAGWSGHYWERGPRDGETFKRP